MPALPVPDLDASSQGFTGFPQRCPRWLRGRFGRLPSGSHQVGDLIREKFLESVCSILPFCQFDYLTNRVTFLCWSLPVFICCGA